jgi:hypothetical protein
VVHQQTRTQFPTIRSSHQQVLRSINSPSRSLSSRRVPLYTWLPIVLACAVAGVVASMLRPIHPPPSNPIPRSEVPSQARVTASPAVEPTRTGGSQLPTAPSPPRGAASITLPTDEIDLPTPASSIAERHAKADDAGMAAPQLPAAQSVPPRASAARTDRSGARTGRATGRAQRTAQQPAKAPSTASAGLKNVPIIGPVFSLFQ